jgi:hypothetical protein
VVAPVQDKEDFRAQKTLIKVITLNYLLSKALVGLKSETSSI